MAIKRIILFLCFSSGIIGSKIVSQEELLEVINLSDGDIGQVLAKKNLDINCCDEDGMTLLMYALWADYYNPGKSEELVKFLLKQPNLDIFAKNKVGCSAIFYAAGYTDPEIFELILRIPNIDINAQDNEGKTPLMGKIWMGSDYHVWRYLLEPDIDISLKDIYGRNALMLVSELAKNKKDPNDCDIINLELMRNKFEEQLKFDCLKKCLKKIYSVSSDEFIKSYKKILKFKANILFIAFGNNIPRLLL